MSRKIDRRVQQAKELSKEDVDEIQQLEEIEIEEEKADAQRRMAWVALLSMIAFTVVVFLPFFPDERIKLLGELSALFYIGMAGIVGAYMGMTAYMSRR
jgi:drug/metabolite transporter (DMT)-like permease